MKTFIHYLCALACTFIYSFTYAQSSKSESLQKSESIEKSKSKNSKGKAKTVTISESKTGKAGSLEMSNEKIDLGTGTSTSTQNTETTITKQDKNITLTQQSTTIPPVSFSELEKYSKDIVKEQPNGKINWTQQFIEAKGQAVIDNERFKNPAQAKAMATRGAVVVAQRNLLEISQGVNVVGETTVQDMATTSDYIYTRVDGIVKGAQQVGPAREVDGMMEITLKMPIYGTSSLASAFESEDVAMARKKMGLKEMSAMATDAGGAEVIDGSKPFVLNFKGKEIDPSMFPVVVDETGNIALDFSKWYDFKSGKFPQYLQLGKEVLGGVGFQKGVDVIDLVQNSKGQFTIPQDSKKRVVWQKIGNVASKIGKVLFSFL